MRPLRWGTLAGRWDGSTCLPASPGLPAQLSFGLSPGSSSVGRPLCLFHLTLPAWLELLAREEAPRSSCVQQMWYHLHLAAHRSCSQGGRICGSPDKADGPVPTSTSPGGKAISLFYPRRFPQPLSILALAVTVLVTGYTSQAPVSPCERRAWTGASALGLQDSTRLFWEARLCCRPSTVHASSPTNSFQAGLSAAAEHRAGQMCQLSLSEIHFSELPLLTPLAA